MLYYEMKAYESLSFVNFYLGELAKADYYQDRFLRGKIENDRSVVKGAIMQFVLAHLDKKRIRNKGTGTKNREDPSGPKFNRLPSPAAGVKDSKNTKVDSKAINLLPHLTELQAEQYQNKDDLDNQIKILKDLQDDTQDLKDRARVRSQAR